MSEIFLSASVPELDRGTFHETANPFLIQCAVRELVIATIRDHRLVWGGHPSITPMIWTICEDLGLKYSERVVLYQSLLFKDRFPEENERFKNVEFTPAVGEDREESLLLMRTRMLSRPEYVAGVFIGGMEGIRAEYDLFCKLQPRAIKLLVASPGGASLQLAQELGLCADPSACRDVDFAQLFHDTFKSLAPEPPRRPRRR